MTEAAPDVVLCRLCTEPVARDAKICPACGVKEPWISDEPTINPHLIRVAMWGGGVVVLGLLVFLAGLIMARAGANASPVLISLLLLVVFGFGLLAINLGFKRGSLPAMSEMAPAVTFDRPSAPTAPAA